MNQKINFAFFGTPALTLVLLNTLKENNLLPSLIVTTPDKPQGRKLILTPTPTKLWAIEHNIPYLQPEKLDDAFIQDLAEKNFDLFVVVAYGKILPEKLIDTPKFGTINVHYSLLPKYRGATPVESAILGGDNETGVCIQKMQYKLDTGPILAMDKLSIPADIAAPALRDELNQRASQMLPDVIRRYIAGEIVVTPQDDTLATHSTKIEKEDGLLDPNGDPILNDRKFRAYFGWPGSYFFVKVGDKNVRIIIKDASLVEGKFTIKRVIPEGKKETDYSVFQKSIL